MVDITLAGVGDEEFSQTSHTVTGIDFTTAASLLILELRAIYSEVHFKVYEGLGELAFQIQVGGEDSGTYVFRDFSSPEEQFDLTFKTRE